MAFYGIVGPDAARHSIDPITFDRIEEPDYRLAWHPVLVDHEFAVDPKTGSIVGDRMTTLCSLFLKGPWAIRLVVKDHSEMEAGQDEPSDGVFFAVNDHTAILVKTKADRDRLLGELAEREAMAS